jgi:hypothetical protein
LERFGIAFDVSLEQIMDGRAAAEHETRLQTYANAWNEQMTAEIRARFGDRVLEDLQAEAEQRHNNMKN